jgi:hypothetical protein
MHYDCAQSSVHVEVKDTDPAPAVRVCSPHTTRAHTTTRDLTLIL